MISFDWFVEIYLSVIATELNSKNLQNLPVKNILEAYTSKVLISTKSINVRQDIDHIPRISYVYTITPIHDISVTSYVKFLLQNY